MTPGKVYGCIEFLKILIFEKILKIHENINVNPPNFFIIVLRKENDPDSLVSGSLLFFGFRMNCAMAMTLQKINLKRKNAFLIKKFMI